MKKIVLALIASLSLVGCGGTSTSTTAACVSSYWDNLVGTCLPAGWTALDRTALDDRGAPSEVLVAFQAQKPVSGQFPTVTVTRETLKQATASSDYSDASVQSVATLPGYTEGDQKKITIDGSSVTLHTYSAQPNADQPKTRFYQVSIAANGVGYTFTGAAPLTVATATENEIKLILTNATLIDPSTKKK